jgi:hypothetical protein
MDEIPRMSSSELSSADAGRWIGRVLIAVILGEGIWGLIVSLTNNLILPLLARTMGADAQSPLYLGKGDLNVPALFISVLELCFAAIVAVILNSWVRRKPRLMRAKPARVSPIPVQPLPPSPPPVVPVQAAVPVPPQTKAAIPAPVTASPVVTPPPGQFWSPPETSRPKAAAPEPPTAKPAKPKPPKEIYYNIVGEPITPDDDE